MRGPECQPETRTQFGGSAGPASARSSHLRPVGGCGTAGCCKRPGQLRRIQAWLDVSLLDLKLGFRMLVKYPGLTLVGGLAMAVVVALGAFFVSYTDSFVRPPPSPLEDVVAIFNWNDQSRVNPSVDDIETWREEARSLVNVGAFLTIERNMIGERGWSEVVSLAVISPSAFRLMRVPPLLGRQA